MTAVILCLTSAGAQTLTVRSETTVEYFQPVTDWVTSIDAGEGLQAYLYIQDLTGSMRVRLGMQTANVASSPGVPTSIGSQSATVSVAGKSNGLLYRFNPNAANDGNVDAAAMFRVGILYSLSAGNAGSAVVAVERLSWR